MNTRLVPLLLVSLLALVPPSAGAQLRLPAPVADPLRIGPLSPAPAPAAAAAAGPKLVDRVVAIVNNEAITERQLELRTRAVGQRLRTQGVTLPPEDELQRQVLERMILDRVQLQAAREQGVRIDDTAIDRAIQSIARDAKLSVPEFRKRIESEGMPFSMFREEIGTEITVSRLRERDFDARTLVSEAEIDAVLAEQVAAGAGGAMEYNIAQIMVRVPEDAGPDEIARAAERAEQIARDARAGADLAALAARMSEGTGAVSGGVLGLRPADRLPPLFLEAVQPLSIGDIAPVVRSPAGFHVLKLLERRAGGVTKLAGAPVRQTRARHILVRVNELNTEAEVVRRLTEIRQRIEGGTAQFPDMARQYSADGSAGQGGDLGWVYPGDTVPEFERAMDALEPGAIAGPVRSPFGYHLIQVVERRTDEASPDRIRSAIRNELRQRKAAEAYQQWVAQTRDRAYVEYRLDER
jgi:peptidyl-prolyl cis-trans isomerase SurA